MIPTLRLVLLSVIVGTTAAVLPSRGVAAPLAQIPACAVGSWRASYPEIEMAFRGLMRPYTVGGLTGDVLYTIQQDGSFEVRYDRLAMNLQSDVEPGFIGVDGAIRGVLSGTEPDSFEGTIAEMSTTVTVALGERNQTTIVESLPEMRGVAPHQCGGGLFLIGTVPFPDGNWVRLIFRKE